MLFMGKSTISMAIFNSFLYVYQRGNSPANSFWQLLGGSGPLCGQSHNTALMNIIILVGGLEHFLIFP